MPKYHRRHTTIGDRANVHWNGLPSSEQSPRRPGDRIEQCALGSHPIWPQDPSEKPFRKRNHGLSIGEQLQSLPFRTPAPCNLTGGECQVRMSAIHFDGSPIHKAPPDDITRHLRPEREQRTTRTKSLSAGSSLLQHPGACGTLTMHGRRPNAVRLHQPDPDFFNPIQTSSTRSRLLQPDPDFFNPIQTSSTRSRLLQPDPDFFNPISQHAPKHSGPSHGEPSLILELQLGPAWVCREASGTSDPCMDPNNPVFAELGRGRRSYYRTDGFGITLHFTRSERLALTKHVPFPHISSTSSGSPTTRNTQAYRLGIALSSTLYPNAQYHCCRLCSNITARFSELLSTAAGHTYINRHRQLPNAASSLHPFICLSSPRRRLRLRLTSRPHCTCVPLARMHLLEHPPHPPTKVNLPRAYWPTRGT